MAPDTAEHLAPDVQELVAHLIDAGVRFLVVGGEAIIFYGYPRTTGDIDLFYDADPENTARIWKALRAFWGGEVPGLSAADELEPRDTIIQFGVPPNRVDLLASIDGVSFAAAWERRRLQPAMVAGRERTLPYIGVDELIENKRATGRPKDLQDVEFLRNLGRDRDAPGGP